MDENLGCASAAWPPGRLAIGHSDTVLFCPPARSPRPDMCVCIIGTRVMSTARFNGFKPRGDYMKTFLGFLVCVVALLMATGPVFAGGDRKYAACYPENESVICGNG